MIYKPLALLKLDCLETCLVGLLHSVNPELELNWFTMSWDIG